MLEERQLQIKTGRIIPQTNEEYGYEDHYPLWAPAPPGDSAETLRRTAWDIAMAGAYGTAGETARRGVNIWPDTGGGWMNGRSDDTTTMLAGYAHMVDFLTSFEWWKTEPHDELVDAGNWCLAEPGRTYAVYLPKAGKVTVRLARGPLRCRVVQSDDGRDDSDWRGRGSGVDLAGGAGPERLGAAATDWRIAAPAGAASTASRENAADGQLFEDQIPLVLPPMMITPDPKTTNAISRVYSIRSSPRSSFQKLRSVLTFGHRSFEQLAFAPGKALSIPY